MLKTVVLNLFSGLKVSRLMQPWNFFYLRYDSGLSWFIFTHHCIRLPGSSLQRKTTDVKWIRTISSSAQWLCRETFCNKFPDRSSQTRIFFHSLWASVSKPAGWHTVKTVARYCNHFFKLSSRFRESRNYIFSTSTSRSIRTIWDSSIIYDIHFPIYLNCNWYLWIWSD